MAYDVAVIGLGGMGSAILAQCAVRGASCIGVEQFEPAHNLGSSHGQTRLIRKAYFEDPAYVPLLLRAYDLWRELEAKTGEEHLRITGLLSVGEEGSEIIDGTRRAAQEHGLALESLGKHEIERRYPSLELIESEVGLFEPDAGVVFPERAVRAHLKIAQEKGAHTSFGLAMQDWSPTRDGFEIQMAGGGRVETRSLVLSLGPWFKATLDSLGVPIRVQRNVQAWFEPATRAYDAPGFPAFLLNRESLPAPVYGMPNFGGGLKAAFHGVGEMVEPQKIERKIDNGRDIEPLVRAMEKWMPGATQTLKTASACMYTLTPDGHFVVDRHPQYSKLIFCGGFSGHGFKFAPVVGEIATELALDGSSPHEIDFLSLRRFARGSRLA